MHAALLRTLLRAGALLGLALAASAQNGSIRVELEEPVEGGRVRLLLFDDPAAFQRFGAAVRIETVPAGPSAYVLTDVPPGTYAFLVHHDRDADGTLDKSFLGIPREPVALSNGYRPKGPPVWSGAAFELAAGEERSFPVALEPVLGERGLLSVGVGVVSRSSPYVGADGGVFQPIPAVGFVGGRLAWLGPNIRYGLAGDDRLRLAATASYRLRAYEERDSPVLLGLGDRRDTLLAGLAVQAELPARLDLGLSYEHDVFDRIGGGRARLGLGRSFALGPARLSPNLGLTWRAADLANHDFGVPVAAATPTRPAYAVGSYTSLDLGLGGALELTESWRLAFQVSGEFLPDDVTDSPIVGDDLLLRGFLALTYAL